MNRRAIAEILTTFFLMLVLVGVTLGIVFFNKSFLLLKVSVNDELKKYNTAFIVRQHLYNCYGTVMDPDLMTGQNCLDGTVLHTDALEKLAHSYIIRQTDLFGCAELTWSWTSAEPPPKNPSYFTYHVPIRDKTTERNCLGKLEVNV